MIAIVKKDLFFLKNSTAAADSKRNTYSFSSKPRLSNMYVYKTRPSMFPHVEKKSRFFLDRFAVEKGELYHTEYRATSSSQVRRNEQ